MKITILGATSHIAKGLIYGISRNNAYELYLFARSPGRVKDFLIQTKCPGEPKVGHFEDFHSDNYDVIVNCVGIGDPGKLKGAESSIFTLTETYDSLAVNYLQHHTDTIYINLSSGAVYGADFAAPVDASTRYTLDINNITPSDYYGLAKLHAEAKHRAFSALNIVDLRVFSYFSCFIDPLSRFLMSDIVSCIKQGKIFETGSDNIVRDYIHRDDLLSLIEKCIARKRINDFYDVYTMKPVSKMEILDYFSREYGLKYVVKDTPQKVSPTGSKENYFSISRKAQKIGYAPQFTSLDCIMRESKAFLYGA